MVRTKLTRHSVNTFLDGRVSSRDKVVSNETGARWLVGVAVNVTNAGIGR